MFTWPYVQSGYTTCTIIQLLYSYFINTYTYKVKVKVTLVQALRLSTGRTAHRGRGISVLFHDQRH